MLTMLTLGTTRRIVLWLAGLLTEATTITVKPT